MTPSTPLRAWTVLAAWMAFIGGVATAALPSALEPLSPASRDAMMRGWDAALADAPARRATLLVAAGAPCACAPGPTARLREWAVRLGMDVREVDVAMGGVALLDAAGTPRFLGDPAALVDRCAGVEGLRAWLAEPSVSGTTTQTVVTSPCPCDGSIRRPARP